MLKAYEWLGDARIDVRYKEGERRFAEDAFATIDEKLPPLAERFGISEVFPKVTVVLVPNREEFDRLVRDLLRVKIEVPSHPARIAQPQRTDMVVLSPPAYAVHSVFDYVPDDFRRLLVHELVHMMEEFASPDIEQTPGWWSEGLAVYLSEQSRFEDGFRRVALQGIETGELPSLEEIFRERKHAYDWGWTLVQFVETKYGAEKLMHIIRECPNGDLLRYLGARKDVFEIHWREWLFAHRNLI